MSARLPDWTADRESEVLFLQRRFGIAIDLVRLAVRVPLRIARDVVHRSAEAVRAALGDRGDLHTARAPELSLVTGRENLHLGDRLHVHLEQRTIAARVHRRDAVHHDVGIAAAAHALRRVVAVLGDAGGKQGERREAPIDDRQVLDRFPADAERSLAALCLDDRGFRSDLHRIGQTADFNRHRAENRAVAGTDDDPAFLQGLEPLHRDLKGVAIGLDVGEREVAVSVREDVGRLGALRFTDERHGRAGNDGPLRILDGAGD